MYIYFKIDQDFHDNGIFVEDHYTPYNAITAMIQLKKLKYHQYKVKNDFPTFKKILSPAVTDH